jgi:shikimate dehydrogenase
MKIDSSTKIVGIFGCPVRHSASPCMHNAAFKALNLNWKYVTFEVKPEQLESAVKSIVQRDIQGVNVTIPHKIKVVPFMDKLSPEAEFTGAVNTIVRRENKLIGYNTDGEGFMKALEENKISPVEKNILLLGAGGASYGICRQLLLKGAKKITIANRTIEKAEDLQKHLMEKHISGNIETLPLETVSLKSALKDTHILINATSVGMKEDDPVLVNEDCMGSSLETVVDIIYTPAQTKLLRIAKEKGIKIMNGLGMLLHQGALSFELWTGKKAPIEVMRKALHEQFI